MTTKLSEVPVSKIRELARAEAIRRGLLNDVLEPRCPEWAHEDQREWYESDATTCIGLAGTQGGKTAMLPHLLLKRAKDAAPLVRQLGRGDMLYIGPTLELLSAQAIPSLQRLWQEELGLGRMVYGGRPKFVLSEEGSRRLWGVSVPGVIRCAYANDSSNLESLTAIAAAWDEAGQKENREESYHAVLRRLAIARSKGFGRLDIGTTPYDWGWLKRIVVDREDGDRVKVFNWPSWANPMFDRSIADDHLETYPRWRWEMMYLGKYTRPAGTVYDCYDDENTVHAEDIPGFENGKVPASWPLYVGLDFGLINTAAVIIAEEMKRDWRGFWTDEPTGNYYVVGTYHAGEQKTAKEHLSAVRDICDAIVDGGKARRPVAVGGSHQESGWREAWGLSGLGVAEPSILRVESQIACLYAAFKTRKLKVLASCSKLLDEITEFAYELDDAGEPTEKLKDEAKFHRLAALRYIGTRLFKAVEMGRTARLRGGMKDNA